MQLQVIHRRIFGYYLPQKRRRVHQRHEGHHHLQLDARIIAERYLVTEHIALDVVRLSSPFTAGRDSTLQHTYSACRAKVPRRERGALV